MLTGKHIQITAALTVATLCCHPPAGADTLCRKDLFLTWYRLAKIAGAQVNSGALNEAEGTWRKALATAETLDSDSSLVISSLTQLVRLSFSLNKKAEIAALLDRQEELEKQIDNKFPGLAEVYCNRGLLMELSNNWKDAAHWFEQAATIPPSYTSTSSVSIFLILRHLALARAMQEQFTECNQLIARYENETLKLAAPVKRAELLTALANDFCNRADLLQAEIQKARATEKMAYYLHSIASAHLQKALSMGEIGAKWEWQMILCHTLAKTEQCAKIETLMNAGQYQRAMQAARNSSTDDARLFGTRCGQRAAEILACDYSGRELLAERFLFLQQQAYGESMARARLNASCKVVWMNARVLSQRGQYKLAIATFRKAEQQARGDRAADDEDLNAFANAAFETGSYLKAEQLWSRCLEHAKACMLTTAQMYYLCRLSLVRARQEKQSAVYQGLEDALQLAEHAAMQGTDEMLIVQIKLLASYCYRLLTRPEEKERLQKLLTRINALISKGADQKSSHL